MHTSQALRCDGLGCLRMRQQKTRYARERAGF
jgi:hypothetical protein